MDPELENMPPPSPPCGDPPAHLPQPKLVCVEDESVPKLVYFHYNPKEHSMYVSPYSTPVHVPQTFGGLTHPNLIVPPSAISSIGHLQQQQHRHQQQLHHQPQYHHQQHNLHNFQQQQQQQILIVPSTERGLTPKVCFVTPPQFDPPQQLSMQNTPSSVLLQHQQQELQHQLQQQPLSLPLNHHQHPVMPPIMMNTMFPPPISNSTGPSSPILPYSGTIPDQPSTKMSLGINNQQISVMTLSTTMPVTQSPPISSTSGVLSTDTITTPPTPPPPLSQLHNSPYQQQQGLPHSIQPCIFRGQGPPQQIQQKCLLPVIKWHSSSSVTSTPSIMTTLSGCRKQSTIISSCRPPPVAIMPTLRWDSISQQQQKHQHTLTQQQQPQQQHQQRLYAPPLLQLPHHHPISHKSPVTTSNLRCLLPTPTGPPPFTQSTAQLSVPPPPLQHSKYGNQQSYLQEHHHIPNTTSTYGIPPPNMYSQQQLHEPNMHKRFTMKLQMPQQHQIMHPRTPTCPPPSYIRPGTNNFIASNKFNRVVGKNIQHKQL